MKNPLPPGFSMTAQDPLATLEAVRSAILADRGTPEDLRVDGAPWIGPADLRAMAAKARDEAVMRWKADLLDYDPRPRGLARFTWGDPVTPSVLRDRMFHVPFLWLTARNVSRVWGAGGRPHKYLAPGFAEGHFGLSWACAFQGDGHAQLVSRRWLDHGPWRIIRADRDTTIIQFHDLEADDMDALEQAKPGHARMGISPTGGFIEPPPFPYKYPALTSLYDRKTRTLTVPVHGRVVEEREMLEACAIRKYQPLKARVDNVAFIFFEEAAARAHLHGLWLRELECRAIIGGREVRLDDGYQPPAPVVPDWVKRVRDRDGF